MHLKTNRCPLLLIIANPYSKTVLASWAYYIVRMML